MVQVTKGRHRFGQPAPSQLTMCQQQTRGTPPIVQVEFVKLEIPVQLISMLSDQTKLIIDEDDRWGMLTEPEALLWFIDLYFDLQFLH